MAAWWSKGALTALAVCALSGCPDGGSDELAREKAALQAEIAKLKAERAKLRAELASRPARPATFEERARKIAEVFATCSDPCARDFVAQPEKVSDPAIYESLKQPIGRCVAKCMQ